MNKKLLLTLMLGMFLISFAFAMQKDIGIVKQGENVTLKQASPNSTYCTLTRISNDGENSNTYWINENMAEIIDDHYEYNFSNTDYLANYQYETCCNPDGYKGCVVVNFKVTADGNETKNFPWQFQIILFGLIMMVAGFSVEKLSFFRFLGGLIFLVMGVVTFYPGYGYINHTTYIGKVLGTVLIGLGIYFVIAVPLEDYSNRKGGNQ